MIEVISVRFKNKGKVYFFAPNGIAAHDGDPVIVETSKGIEFADCTWGNHWVDDSAVVQPLRPVIRIATEADIQHSKENKLREADAFRICQEKIEHHELDMKLVDVEYSFDGSKILFFFTSDGRVDFRELVKDLAAIFHTRIELRQIGVRDEAKMLGGLGICGRPFCCSQFLDDFHPVSIKMAKTQGLSLNPTKISGTCGRLMCCLKYEQIAYEDLVKQAPKVDAFVDTPGGKGSVVGINLLRSYAKVKLEDTNDATLKLYPFDELEILGGKARRAEYLAAKAEGRLEDAGFAPSHIRQSRFEKVTPTSSFDDEAPFVFADGTTPEPQEPEKVPESPSKSKSKNHRSKKKSQSKEESKVQASPNPAQVAAASQQNKPTKQQSKQQKPQQPRPTVSAGKTDANADGGKTVKASEHKSGKGKHGKGHSKNEKQGQPTQKSRPAEETQKHEGGESVPAKVQKNTKDAGNETSSGSAKKAKNNQGKHHYYHNKGKSGGNNKSGGNKTT